MDLTAFTCPYCFERVKKSNVQFRCINPRCKDFDDDEMSRYENMDMSLPTRRKGKRTFQGKSSNPFTVPWSANCPEEGCGKETYKKICPKCHNELPESTLKGTDMIISVVGTRDSGKSHFVGVIIKELRDRISSAFNASLEGFADSSSRYKQTFEKNLYGSRHTLPLTISSLVDANNGAYRPLIYSLQMRPGGFWEKFTTKIKGKDLKSFTFVFFDTAGEDLNDEDTMSTVNKYICRSAGIIFLLDPLKISYVRDQVDETTVKKASSVELGFAGGADDIMTRVSNLIRKDAGMTGEKKIDIPVAAVFSKFDALAGDENLIPSDLTICGASPHCDKGIFDTSDFHSVNAEVRALLTDWGEAAFIQQVELNYRNSAFFTVSSLGMGNAPDSSGSIARPNPHRIEDPLLWLLKENGVIRAK
jgi:hypothetical protein